MVCGLFISAAHEHGISATAAGTYLALIGVFDIIGTMGSGWLTDRFDPRVLLCGYYLLRGLSLLVLDPALTVEGGGLLGFMVFYGLDWVATVPPTIAPCVQIFGRQCGPLVYGWVFAGHQVGGALAAWGAGELFAITGSYRASFVVVGIGCLIAAVAVMRIDRQPVVWSPVPGPLPA